MNLNLIEPVKVIIEKVKELTGKDIEFIEKNDLITYSAIKMARKNMPSHLIFYKAEHDEIMNHVIVHECGHILRIFGVSEEKRLMPRTNEQIKLNALAEIEPEIQSLSSVLPFNKLAQIINIWYEGTIRQLTNYPSDIMIEKWLYDEYPELRPYQLQSIEKQYKEALISLSPQVAKMTPQKFLDVANIMNYVFFRILGMHFKVNYIRPYNNSPDYLSKGKKLASITTEDYVDNYEGDIEMVNKWTDFLDLKGWFEWVNFKA